MTQRLRLQGLPWVLQLCLRDATSRGIPGSGRRVKPTPFWPPQEASSPPPQGLERPPRPQLSRKGDWSGGRYLGAVLQRLLQQQLVHRGHGAARRDRGPDGRTEGGRRGRRGWSVLRRRGGRSMPVTAPRAPTPDQWPPPPARRPSSRPGPPASRINRKCGQRPAGRRKCGGPLPPQTPRAGRAALGPRAELTSDVCGLGVWSLRQSVCAKLEQGNSRVER